MKWSHSLLPDVPAAKCLENAFPGERSRKRDGNDLPWAALVSVSSLLAFCSRSGFALPVVSHPPGPSRGPPAVPAALAPAALAAAVSRSRPALPPTAGARSSTRGGGSGKRTQPGRTLPAPTPSLSPRAAPRPAAGWAPSPGRRVGARGDAQAHAGSRGLGGGAHSLPSLLFLGSPHRTPRQRVKVERRAARRRSGLGDAKC